MCEETKQETAQKEALFWEMVKTLSMLIERIEAVVDGLHELYDRAEHERQQARVAVIEQYLRKRLDVEPEQKKGANKNGLYSTGRPEAINR